MKTTEKRKMLLDYLIKNQGFAPSGKFIDIGFTYMQDFCNQRNALMNEGYITKIGRGKYLIKNQIYDKINKTDISYELKRLRDIEKKYNQICKICLINTLL